MTRFKPTTDGETGEIYHRRAAGRLAVCLRESNYRKASIA
jgi:hypothetical protein